MSAKTLTFAMLSDPGRVRTHNEDACAADAEQGIFVVCDGVGGAASGEIASRIAADAFLAQMVSGQRAGTALDIALPEAIEHANRLVHRQAHQTTAQHGMATTLVALSFTPHSEGAEEAGTVWFANIGDSRCYRLRDDHFEQLTRDHSLVEEQVRSGEITRAQAEVSPIRNVITRAIGSDPVVEPDLSSLPAHHGDLYMLCSDGLTRDLSDSDIAAILRGAKSSDDGALALVCERLIQAANEKGGGDNITCLLVQIS